MNKFIPLSIPNLCGRELEYLTDAINQGWVSTGGNYITSFEQHIAEYLGASGAVACQSGTAGLHLAMRLCDVGIGDEVIVPTLTFIAAVNPVRYSGAEPVFMDCDDDLCMDTEKLEKFLSKECELNNGTLYNKTSHKRIKAIEVVHVFGNICNMERVMDIAEHFGLPVVEDATEALGSLFTAGRYKGMYAGTVGNIGVYSFNGNKIITTGGGGMLVARSSNDLKRARYLSTQAKDDEKNFIHGDVGYNYRMTNVQAAIGVAQLEKLEDFIEVKRNNYQLYIKLLSNIPGLSILPFKDNIRTNYWFYSLCVCKEEYGMSSGSLIKYLSKNGIQSRPIWGLIGEQKPYIKNQSYDVERAPYFRELIVNLPCSTNLKSEEVEFICNVIKNAWVVK
jgi:perosamine synthetase